MPRKVVPLVNGEMYHIYNRGVDKRNVFKTKEDFERFKLSIQSFNIVTPTGSIFELNHSKLKDSVDNDPLVEINAYCFLPNHFHLILTQVADGGISEFMKRLGGGYTSYFNEQYERSGSLFQGTFKRVHISTDEQMRYVTAYVNLNYIVHGIPETSAVSSIDSYTNISPEKFVKPNFVNKSESLMYKKSASLLVEQIKKTREDQKLETRLAALSEDFYLE